MKAALYARVSTEGQERDGTIDSQIASLRQFAKDEGYELAGEFIDDGYSGELFARPGLDKLRDAAEKTLFDIVIVLSPDRLSRRLAYQVLIKDELAEKSISIVYLSNPKSQKTPENDFLENIQGCFAEYEKAKILERTRRGKLHKVSEGKLMGGKSPYGYKYNPETRMFEIIENEAQVVKKIFEMAQRPLSVRKIARELKTLGLKARCGEFFGRTTINRILKNETYCCRAYWGKHERTESKTPRHEYQRSKKTSLKLKPRDTWKLIQLPESCRIIGDHVFEKVQAILKQNKELSPRNAKHDYLLRGLIFCGKCGGRYVGVPSHGVFYYRCGRELPGGGRCKERSILVDKIETEVWNELSIVITDPSRIAEIKALEGKKTESEQVFKEKINQIDREIKRLDLAKNQAADLYLFQEIDKPFLMERLGVIKHKKKLLEDKKNALLNERGASRDREKLLKLAASLKGLSEVLRFFDKHCPPPREEMRNQFLSCVKKVVVNRENIQVDFVFSLQKEYETGKPSPRSIAPLTSYRYGTQTDYFCDYLEHTVLLAA